MNSNKENGFSLLEILIAVAVMGVVFYGMTQLSSMISSNKREVTKKLRVKDELLVDFKVYSRSMENLFKEDLDEYLLYTASGSNIVRPLQAEISDEDLNEREASENKFTSFKIVREIRGADGPVTWISTYVSYCTQAQSPQEIRSREDLTNISVWPFATYTLEKGLSIYCCEQAKPNCREADRNILDSRKSKYVVRTVKIHKNVKTGVENFNSEIKQGDVPYLHSKGFFVAKPEGQPNTLSLLRYNLWSDCTKRKLDNVPLDNCKERTYRYVKSATHIYKDVPEMKQGVMDLGNLGI